MVKNAGPFVVFTLSDDTSAKLPAVMIKILVKPGDKAILIKILTLHVMPGQVVAADVADKKLTAPSVEGECLQTGGTDGMLVNGAKRLSLKVSATGFGGSR